MRLVIVIGVDVANRDEGLAIYTEVKQMVADRPEINISGHVTSNFELEKPGEVVE